MPFEKQVGAYRYSVLYSACQNYSKTFDWSWAFVLGRRQGKPLLITLFKQLKDIFCSLPRFGENVIDNKKKITSTLLDYRYCCQLFNFYVIIGPLWKFVQNDNRLTIHTIDRFCKRELTAMKGGNFGNQKFRDRN